MLSASCAARRRTMPRAQQALSAGRKAPPNERDSVGTASLESGFTVLHGTLYVCSYAYALSPLSVSCELCRLRRVAVVYSCSVSQCLMLYPSMQRKDQSYFVYTVPVSES